jgi:BMFP domain-containing protein YqiC
VSIEFRYSDKVAADVESALRKVPADKLAAADMIAFQREVIQELRSQREAQNIRIAALEEENRQLRKPHAKP